MLINIINIYLIYGIDIDGDLLLLNGLSTRPSFVTLLIWKILSINN